MLPKNLPIYVDSPLAIKATEIFRKFPEYYDGETRAVAAAGEDPFDVPGLRFTPSTEESQAINAAGGPAVIISASGMANAGRIKHHLRHNLWRPGASIVFVGYQAIGTPGRKLVDGARSVRILGEDTAVKAKIFTIGGFSAHAGQSQLLSWVEKFAHPDMMVVLVHGEEKAQAALSGLIEARFGLKAVIPGYLEELDLVPGAEAAIVPAVAPDGAIPPINWDTLFAVTRATMDLAQSRKDSLSRHEWAVQAEFRDKLLEINSELARFASQA
jgi:metallo-beta-lactamase family protein